MTHMTVGEYLRARGVTRREFLRFCAAATSAMALPVALAPQVARALENARRPSVIWLPFQECTGCTESITRSHGATIEGMIFDAISLDYQHTLQAASGTAAEHAREQAMKDNWGNYLLIVDGSVPTGNAGYGTIAGMSNLEMLREAAKGAGAIVALGSCATFGGIPMAKPNPTGAVPVSEVIKGKPIINVPGCPPIPVVITGVLMQYLTFGRIPELDSLGRPLAFYGQTIHDRCYRRPFYERGEFAETFDDEGARKGWCLYKLGCKGPTTYNACATAKWNGGVSFPIEAGHGCIGCSEPRFWDKGGFYQPLSTGDWGSAATVGTAVGVGVALGAAAALAARRRQSDLEKKA
jgi:hydrogenase small subunit